MRQSLAILLAMLLLLPGLTACGETQKTAASGTPQGTGQYGGNMPQGERPTGERMNANRAEGAQMRVRDSGAPDFNENNDSAGISRAQKIVTGRVQSIVGNEVVLIITQSSDTAGRQKNQAETDKAAAVSQEENGTAKLAEQEAEAQAAVQADFSEGETPETTQTYLIPVGMAVGDKDFSSIKAGNTLNLYFGTDPGDGSEIITAVELRQQGAANGAFNRS